MGATEPQVQRRKDSIQIRAARVPLVWDDHSSWFPRTKRLLGHWTSSFKIRSGLGKPGKAGHLTIRAALWRDSTGIPGKVEGGEDCSARGELLELSGPHWDFLWAKLSLRLSGLRKGEG